MNNLKPCPHCDSTISERRTNVYTIICPSCGVRMMEPLGYEEHARKRWNTRAHESELERYRQAEVEGQLVMLPCSGKEFEVICESVHNAWWDEKKKQGIFDHPDAIPYDRLSEEVKEYDRVTVRAVLRALQALAHEEAALTKTKESEGYNEP